MKTLPPYLAAGLLLLPLPLSGQTDSVPPWVLRGADITDTSLDEILTWARTLDFDLDIWDAPVGPLLLSGPTGPYLGPRARIAARQGARTRSPDALPSGGFVGLIQTEADVPALGAVQGRTYVWVDRRGPGERWRALLYPDRAWPGLPSLEPSPPHPDTAVFAVEVSVEVFRNLACADAQGAFLSGVARCFVWDCTVICTGEPLRRVGYDAPSLDPLRDGWGLGPLWNPKTGSGGPWPFPPPPVAR